MVTSFEPSLVSGGVAVFDESVAQTPDDIRNRKTSSYVLTLTDESSSGRAVVEPLTRRLSSAFVDLARTGTRGSQGPSCFVVFVVVCCYFVDVCCCCACVCFSYRAYVCVEEYIHGAFVGVRVPDGHDFLGQAQFQLRRIARDDPATKQTQSTEATVAKQTQSTVAEQWYDTVQIAQNFTETRDCARYDKNGKISGWMFKNSSLSSYVFLDGGYNVARMQRSLRRMHVLAEIGTPRVCLYVWL